MSYDLCDEVEALYSWARIVPVTMCYTTAKMRGALSRARRTEVVVVPMDTVPLLGGTILGAGGRAARNARARQAY